MSSDRRSAPWLLVSLVVIAVSAVPLVLAYPILEEDYLQFAKARLQRDPLPPPEIDQDPYRPVDDYGDAVPVLQYHGINDADDGYSVDRETFAGHMQMLADAGYQTIGIEDLVAHMRGEKVDMPERPILITFDDGRLDSYRGAEEVLRQHGFSAVMFAIPGALESPFYLNWDELREMEESGVWDVQPHAFAGHQMVEVNDGGESGPFYANRLHVGQGELESFEDYKERVTTDVLKAVDAIESEIPDADAVAFAAPYGNVGEDGSNDPSIERFFLPWLLERFDVVFTHNEIAYNEPDPEKPLTRMEIRTDTTTEDLYRWLTKGAAAVN